MNEWRGNISSRSQVFHRIAALKYFSKFTRNTYNSVSFLVKLQSYNQTYEFIAEQLFIEQLQAAASGFFVWIHSSLIYYFYTSQWHIQSALGFCQWSVPQPMKLIFISLCLICSFHDEFSSRNFISDKQNIR